VLRRCRIETGISYAKSGIVLRRRRIEPGNSHLFFRSRLLPGRVISRGASAQGATSMNTHSDIPAEGDRLRTFGEACRRLNLGSTTLREKLRAGIGPKAIKLPGSNRWRFRDKDLDAYEEANVVVIPAEPEDAI
jgi:hypothetical protein